jgi:hypothetical protein
MGRLSSRNGGQRCSRESQKTALGSQETYLKQAWRQPKKESTYSTLSQGMLKKGDVVDDADDSDDVKTSAS